MAEDLDRLWAAWDTDRTQGPFNAILVAGQPLIRSVVRSMQVPTWCDRDDLIGAGQFGLIDAIEAFDRKHGVKFTTYAGHKVRSKAKEEIRRSDWVPKRVRSEGRQLDDADLTARAKFGRAGTDTEIAKLLGIDVERLAALRIRQIGATSVSLFGTYNIVQEDGSSQSTLMDSLVVSPTSTESAHLVETIEQRVAEAIVAIADPELKVVMLLRYGQGLTMPEIAAVMGYSKAKISKLLDTAMAELRERISAST